MLKATSSETTRGGRAGRGGASTWDDFGTDRYPMTEEDLTRFAVAAGGAQLPYESYVPPEFQSSQILRFDGNYPYSSPSAWNTSLLDRQGIKSLVFGPGFHVHDHHIAEITTRPGLCQSLISLTLGDSKTGSGGALTDATVTGLARACTRLKVLILDAATRVTNVSLFAICESCQGLELLRITGSDKVPGGLTPSGLNLLAAEAGWVPRLKELILYDQPLREKDIVPLSKIRRDLVIKEGLLADGGFTSTMKGGKMIGTDMGFGEIDVSNSGMDEDGDEAEFED